MILSPCHLASIPLIVGYVSGQAEASTRRALLISSLFAFGILVTIGLIGLLTAALGLVLGDLGLWLNYVVAEVFFAVGLYLLEIIPQFTGGVGQLTLKTRGLVTAFLLGLILGVALGPCTFAYLAPMLAVTFKAGAGSLIFGSILLLVYGIGHCSVIVAAGTSVQFAQRLLNWSAQTSGQKILKRICGVLVILGGVYMIYKTL